MRQLDKYELNSLGCVIDRIAGDKPDFYVFMVYRLERCDEFSWATNNLPTFVRQCLEDYEDTNKETLAGLPTA